ncbi:hypothetical protein [Motiliproteus coralliicola]|uniref:hypothetical protein n=1 Tax=Motiliproteus coralliicola TaxID=2283196 RepID=UPI0010590D14|nr:hypothetical protein [Motiliproteus coralliicola]
MMIHLKPEDLPAEGLRVKYRCGELFEKKIEWGDISEGLLVAQSATNDQNENGVNVEGSDLPGYAGFESRTGNYWRYQHESDPDVFREHCMQVVEIQEPFSPRSSWEAWVPLVDTLSKERMRLTLKNEVTGAELSYKVLNRGFGYQIKDLTGGRRVQKILKHDYILNQLLGTSFKKLDYHHVKIETTSNGDDEVGGSLSITFEKQHYQLQYRFTEQVFSLTLFDTAADENKLLKRVELPHSDVIEDTRTFLG